MYPFKGSFKGSVGYRVSGSMYPNSIYFGLKVLPIWVLWGSFIRVPFKGGVRLLLRVPSSYDPRGIEFKGLGLRGSYRTQELGFRIVIM